MNNSASINRKTGINQTELKEMVPSIFATKKHSSRSDRYEYMPTVDVLDHLRKSGFVPVQAFQSKVHKDVKSRTPFTKHLIRLRDKKSLDLGDKLDALIPEVVLTNSHDGTSSFQLEAGLFRLVCSNGLVIRDKDFGSIRVPHIGKVSEKVLEGAKSIIEYLPKIIRFTKEWDKIKLSDRQRLNFAKLALDIRFPAGGAPITPQQVLEVRRNTDEAPSLWRTFNVVQENLLTGGQQGHAANGRAVSTKRVTSVNNSLRYNRGLWELAETFAKRA